MTDKIEVANDEKRCETCEFCATAKQRQYIGEVAGGGPVDDVNDEGNWSHWTEYLCRRYPEQIKVSSHYKCGEYKPKKGEQ